MWLTIKQPHTISDKIFHVKSVCKIKVHAKYGVILRDSRKNRMHSENIHVKSVCKICYILNSRKMSMHF